MFLYFDRCLLRDSDLLNSLNLGSWLIDARGESDAYLSAALDAYAAIRNHEGSDAAMAHLHALSGRPQRPGFFRQNSTDQDRDRRRDNRPILGMVRDVHKGSYMILEFKEMIPVFPPQLTALTPTHKEITFKLEDPRDAVSLAPVQGADVGQLILVDWTPGGMISKSVVVA